MIPKEKMNQLIRIAESDNSRIVTAWDLREWSEADIQQFEQEEYLLFQGYADTIRCGRCHKGCTVELTMAQYPDGQTKGVFLCSDEDEGGRIEFEMKELRVWEVNRKKIWKSAYGFNSEWQVPWDDDNPDYIPLQEAVNIADDDSITVKNMSRLLKDPEFPIHHMHKGKRCKVHLGEFRRWLKYAKYGTITDEAIERYIAGIQERTADARKKKISGPDKRSD